ncbi:LLM class flavin-dependent oxidoreductase [Williamsia soli]|uniref:LLM class flavin-dependent oxidoreductase n=1 Tax=Williamsia soli TaxID=364929 RepID=UPI001A9DDC6A|nr:LLM class flavin-dependent oxidoreductase [Williamsia soli]
MVSQSLGIPSTGIPSLGITFLPAFAPERLREVARAADSAGLDELWLWEDCFRHGGLVTASAALAWTSRITVGVGLLPVPLRNIGVAAMELASLHRLFPDRVLAGIGHGVQSWMGQVGARVDSPMTLLSDYELVLRDLLAGDEVTFDGAYLHVDAVKLEWPPTVNVPLLIGGEGPRSLGFAARSGDGVLLTAGLGEAEIGAACDLVRAEAAGAGKPMPPVVVPLITATGAGAADRVAAEVARWKKSDRDDVGVAGDAEEIAATILRLAALGVTSVAVQPTEDELDLPGLCRVVGERVRPILTES